MRLNKLTIKNLRLYGEDEQTLYFAPDKNITVLLGDNGAGKTSLLYGATVLLSQFLSVFPGSQRKTFVKEDVRNVNNETRADYVHVGIDLVPTCNENDENIPFDIINNKNHVEADMYVKGNMVRNAPESKLKSIKDYANILKEKIDNSETVALPIVAFYGTERGHIKPVERRRDFKDVFPRWDIYKSDALESVTDFKRFFTWFERNEDLERRERERLWDRNYTSHVLDAVRRALEIFFDHLRNPRVETGPLRFVMDDITNPNNPIETRIERMSDGYRISVALIADIAARLAEANPTLEGSGIEDPLNANGIVLIDEIDLHLHPRLHREILRRLSDIFPNVQFIVSTHSPNVILGALELVQVVKLNHGLIDSNINTSQYEKYDVSLVLLSDLFDIDNVRTKEFKDIEKEEDELLSKDSLTNDELNRLKEIALQLSLYGYSDGEERRR